MNELPLISPNGIDGPEVKWEDGERVFSRERRLTTDGRLTDVLTVTFTAEHPTPADLDRFTHEYALKDELDGPWAVRPLALIRERGRTVLVLDDPASEPLHPLLGTPMEPERFLRLAIAITSSLVQLHRRGLVHKDLKPANILVNAAGEVRFTGFGIASRLSRERQALEPPETIAGTFAYMAPEQTGRMNRSIDSRSDLYSLGVTLYEMLTGALPFTAADPMEWVHCHVARQAMPPAERTNDVPGIVSAIVMKLLAKTAEERYQTAAGLKSDLQRCLAARQNQGQIEYFRLGEHDTPDRLLIPEKLYGREREIESLLASFDRVLRGRPPELVLISGYSGIGKSALVEEFHTAVVSRGGLYASGKFDQHKRDIPYATLAQAFQSLVRQLLAKSDSDLAPWREALCHALDSLGRLIVDLAPELQLIIGDQPEVPEVSPQDAQRRFQLVVRRFIAVFARPDHPLALFLDDLQWLDMATLDLLDDLLTRSDLEHLLLIGAYRHNEVDAAHPLTRKLDIIRDAGARVQEINLAPLTLEGVERFTADTLRCNPSYAAPLAQLIYEKTDGNPFFLIQFLYALVEEELLTFNHDKSQWNWDPARIHAKGYTANVADLMIAKLNGLPDEVREALLELAGLGNSADLATLAIVTGTSEQQVRANLGEAARLQLIERNDDSYKFVHDRVQEAAYALCPDEDRPALHLRNGMALAAQATLDETSEKLYLIANQLNRGIAAVTRDAEREQIIAVNLAAGRRARNAAAYNTALAHVKIAQDLLGDKAHPGCSADAFAIALQRAECEFLVGHLDIAEAQLLVLSQNSPSLQMRADVTRLQANLYAVLGQLARGVAVCLDFLRLVGIDWQSHPTDPEVDEEGDRLRSLAGQLSDDELHAMQPMTDPTRLATMAVVADLITPALLTDLNLSHLTIMGAARLTLQYGTSESACYPLVSAFSVSYLRYADPKLGLRLARVGLSLANGRPQQRFSGRTIAVFGYYVTPWVEPIRLGPPEVRRGKDIVLATGDLTWVAWLHWTLTSIRFFCGDPLMDIWKDAEQGVAFAKAAGFELPATNLAIQRDLTLNLTGCDKQGRFEVAGRAERHPLQDTWPQNACLHYVTQIQINVLAGRYDTALAFAAWANEIFRSVRANLELVEYRFYSALAHAGAHDASPPERREMHVGALRHHHHELTVRCAHAPANFADRLTLLAAEIARIEGRQMEAAQLFDKSIRMARETGFAQIEAIASECAARFYAAHGIRTVMLSYLTNARDCYLRWGADAKVRQLDTDYSELRRNEHALGPTPTIGAPVEQLDLATVLKVSEAVSGEIVLDKLIETLMRIALEHAGAERGLLLLPQGSGLQILAEATIGDASVKVDLRNTPVSGAEVPDSLILYTLRTQESVILDDASASEAFENDAYVRRMRPRSVLCLPLIKQGEPVAVLYLENNLAPRVFTPARVAVLKFLASEAATSIENARLYHALQERESKIRRLVDANIIGICIFGPEGDIFEANQAFLKTVGYDREDVDAGRLRWTNLTPPEWSERNARAHAELAATGAFHPFEKEYFRKDGSRAPILIGAASFDEQHAVVFVLDLSERKRAEAEARESEQRYREVQMELAHANRVAVTGLLTASIAHEVSQPTTAVTASAQAALHWLDHQPPELEQVRQALARIIQNGMRASEVIERIRDLVKKTPPRRDCLAINAIIGEVIDLLQAEAARSGVLVETAFTDGLPEVVGDRVELQQVAVNLILNAIEAMNATTDGPRKLLIRTETADNDAVLVAIMDSGPGLSPASLERLFDPFYTTKQGGLGIGLSICRSIIEAYGGRLWVSANQPRGAIFQFTVPAQGCEST